MAPRLSGAGDAGFEFTYLDTVAPNTCFREYTQMGAGGTNPPKIHVFSVVRVVSLACCTM